MQNETLVVGLDIGTTKICSIVGKKNEYGKLEILGLGKTISYGVSQGVVKNIEKTVNSIIQAIKETQMQTGISIGLVNVGIAGQHIKSLQHRGVMIRKSDELEIHQNDINQLIDDMYRLVFQPGDKIIHVMPQDYIVDNEDNIKDPIGRTGIRLEGNFHIITGQISAINNINKCVKRAGLEIDEMILEPLASCAAVLSDSEKEAGVALIDIGGGTTDIAIFQDGIIRHTAVIPFGGNIISKDIRDGLGILPEQAEQLKVKFGSALANETRSNELVSIPSPWGREAKEILIRNLAHIIQSRMEEIIEHVAYEIHSSGFASKLSAGIVLTGGGALLQHVCQLFEYMTGLETRIGYPNEHLGKCKIEEVKSPIYSTGIGLVLAGFDSLDQRKKNTLSQTHASPSKVDFAKDLWYKINSGFKRLLIDEELDEKQQY